MLKKKSLKVLEMQIENNAHSSNVCIIGKEDYRT